MANDPRFWHPTIYEWRYLCELHPEYNPHSTLMRNDGTAMAIWLKDKPEKELEEGKKLYDARMEQERQQKIEERKRREEEQKAQMERTEEEMYKSMVKRERHRESVIHKKEMQPEWSKKAYQKQALTKKAVTADDPFEASVLNAVDKDQRSRNGNYIIHARRISDLPKISLSDPIAIHERIDWYFQLCITDGIRPNLPGLALCFGLTRTGLMNALSDRRMTRECADEIGRGIAMMDTIISEMALGGAINPVSVIYFMNNWLGYKNASEVTTRSEQVETAVDQKALEQKYNTVIDME